MTALRFDIHGRMQLELVRHRDEWRMFRIGTGLRSPVLDFAVPAHLKPEELRAFLEDIYHEYAAPGTAVKRI